MDRPGYNQINGIAVADICEDGSYATSRPKDLCPECMEEFIFYMERGCIKKEKTSFTKEIANEKALEAYHKIKTYCKGHECENCIFVIEKDILCDNTRGIVPSKWKEITLDQSKGGGKKC